MVSDDYQDRIYMLQDGAACPRKAPWDRRVSKLTGLPFLLTIALGALILAIADPILLIIWLAVWVIFFYPLRYLVCARCPYYGQTCSSSMGRTVTKMFRKQDDKSMKPGLWLDVVCFILLLAIPLPAVWRLGGIYLLLAWLAVFFLMFAVLTRLACLACPFSFCPIGKGGRFFWRALGIRESA